MAGIVWRGEEEESRQPRLCCVVVLAWLLPDVVLLVAFSPWLVTVA